MKCPQCGSENVHEMRFQNREAQVACNECPNHGTYYEFSLDKDLNIGLATQYEGAILYLEHDMMDASDPSYTVAITVHKVGIQSACNFWARYYDQWLKVIPERVMDQDPSSNMLHGEVIRLIQSDKGVKFSQDMRWRMALISLQQHAIAMSQQ